mmetsp:Transcript_117146/g.261783  ORF Transcript_117146/g.261783 Transcript_117146/m.261783 type:complete len:167 (-) Transcript_117146:131-631(-)
MLQHLSLTVCNSICNSDMMQYGLPEADTDALLSAIIRSAPALKTLKLSPWNCTADGAPWIFSKQAATSEALRDLHTLWLRGPLHFKSDLPNAGSLFPSLEVVMWTPASLAYRGTVEHQSQVNTATKNALKQWVGRVACGVTEFDDPAISRFPCAWLCASPPTLAFL